VHWEQNYKALYAHDYDGPHFDWPPYRPVEKLPSRSSTCAWNTRLRSLCATPGWARFST
jgi:hypothetical protein